MENAGFAFVPIAGRNDVIEPARESEGHGSQQQANAIALFHHKFCWIFVRPRAKARTKRNGPEIRSRSIDLPKQSWVRGQDLNL